MAICKYITSTFDVCSIIFQKKSQFVVLTPSKIEKITYFGIFLREENRFCKACKSKPTERNKIVRCAQEARLLERTLRYKGISERYASCVIEARQNRYDAITHFWGEKKNSQSRKKKVFFSCPRGSERCSSGLRDHVSCCFAGFRHVFGQINLF